jgi:hypothetical protein
MAKAKQGDLFSCGECGLIVTVDQACGCASADLICCKQPMAKGKLAANKARNKAVPHKSGCAVKKTTAKKAPAKKAPAKKATTSKK